MENKLPTNITLSELVREAKGLTAQEGILPTIQFIKKHLPENCPKFDLLILLERRYDKTAEDAMKGILSYERENEELNKTRESLLNYINTLKESDFCEQTATEAPDLRIGKTMYRIPEKMQVNQESECHIWIAFDLETILNEVQQEAGDEARDIRISNVMGVELFDHSQGEAFEISTYNETEQIIEKGLSTEWIFYVKPLKEGKFPLILRIAVIETVNGEKVHKTKVLREIVQIVAEAPEAEVTTSGVAAKEAEGLVFMTGEENPVPVVLNAPQSEASAAPPPKAPITPKSNWRKRIPAMGGVMAVFLGLIIAVNAGLFESSSPMKTEVPGIEDGGGVVVSPGESHSIEPSPVESAGTEIFIDTLAWWNYLKTEGDTAEISAFLKDFSNSEYEPDARDRLAFLIDSLVNLTKNKSKSKPNKPKQTNEKSKGETTSKPKPSTATTPITKPATSPKPMEKPKTEPVASFKNVARKPVHPKCKKKKSSKQNACTEEEIQETVEDYLRNISGLKGNGVVSFVIGTDGKVTDIKMLKSDNNQLTKEVIKAIKKLPSFQPGQNQLEVPVKVAYYLPVKVVH